MLRYRQKGFNYLFAHADVQNDFEKLTCLVKRRFGPAKELCTLTAKIHHKIIIAVRSDTVTMNMSQICWSFL